VAFYDIRARKWSRSILTTRERARGCYLKENVVDWIFYILKKRELIFVIYGKLYAEKQFLYLNARITTL